MKFRKCIPTEPNFKVDIKDCLAKTEKVEGDTVRGMTVKEHCLLTGCIAKEIFLCIHGLNDRIPNIQQCDLIASLHDIGKISKPFQNMIYGSLSDKEETPSYIKPTKDTTLIPCRHDSIGQIFVEDYGKQSNEKHAWKAIAKIIGGHHGNTPSQPTFLAEDDVLGGKPYNDSRKKLLNELIEEIGSDLPENLEDRDICFLTGLTIVADWISSSVGKNELDSLNYSTIAKNKTIQSGYDALKVIHSLSFSDIFGFEPYKVQKDFFDSVNDNGTYILEVEMGKGKTEAALYASYKLLEKRKATGIYFALPTRITSLSIYKRMLSFIEKITEGENKAKLVFQNSNLYLDAYGENCTPGGDWFDSKKRGILAPFGVGTIDQALMSVINVKHSALRAFGLTGKVVIIDELHSYDEYTGSLILNLVKLVRELGGTVIILSATLRSATKKNILGQPPQMNAYPLITYATCDSNVKEITTEPSIDKQVSLTHLNISNALELAIENAINTGKVLWISNTVEEAQNVFSIISSRCQGLDIKVGLLHSHFTQIDRKRIEDEYLPLFTKKNTRSNKGVILVGTQVLEQSLDIDADLLITEIAPIDMLLQRIGRLWRHKENNDTRTCIKPECVIIHPSFDSAKSNPTQAFGVNGVVYAPYVLYRTLKTLYGVNQINVPSDIRNLIENTYAYQDSENPMILKAYEDLILQRNRMESEARNAKNMAQITKTDSEAVTRYQSQKTSTILLLKYFNPIEKSIGLLDGQVIYLKENPTKQDRIKIGSLLLENTMTLGIKIIPSEAFLLDNNSMLNPYIYFGDKEKNETGVLLVNSNGKLMDIYNNEICNNKLDYSNITGYRLKKEAKI